MAEERIWEKYRNRSGARSGGSAAHEGYGNAGYHDRSRRPEKPSVQAKSGTSEELRKLLLSIDHRGYPAYKDLTGQYRFTDYILSIDHVQGDPFASPSSLSIHVTGEQAGFPERMWKTYENRRALQDHLIRLFSQETSRYTHQAGGSGKSGLIACSHPGQEVLDRSACQADPKSGALIFRFYVGFPAAGRTVLAKELEKILFDFLPEIAGHSLFYRNIDRTKLQSAIDLTEDQTFLREEMKKNGWVAFVADGAVLPRESGVSQKPMPDAVPFYSPEEDAVTAALPHRGAVRGMAIPAGITLIIGGGYHGKSTLLQALERGVYNHINGDGRELVLTDATAMKIRAEDGRCVMKDDISPFIRNLPNGKNTVSFSSEDASGSTSQAASVVEAIESGTNVLLMDEDTCATNFMVRDDLMQQIVSADEEPIVPYSQTMRPLFLQHGISTILVAGSSGAFFSVADRILQMDQYVPKDVTARVRELVPFDHTDAALSGQHRHPETAGRGYGAVSTEDGYSWDFSVRMPKAGTAFSGRDGDGRVKLKSLGKDGFMIGHETVDLRAVEQIVDSEQTECLAQMLLVLSENMNGTHSLRKLIDALMAQIRASGISAAVRGRLPGNLALPRAQELYAAIDRCRAIRM